MGKGHGVNMFGAFPLTKTQIILGHSYLLSFIFGAICCFLLFRTVKKLFKDERSPVLAVLLFICTPGFYYIAIFDIAILFLLLIFLLVCVFFIEKRKLLSLAGMGCFLISMTYFYNLSLLPTPVFKTALPHETSYIIDRDLSIGFLFHSPLIIGDANWARLAYNKVVFGIDTLFKQGISFLDF